MLDNICNNEPWRRGAILQQEMLWVIQKNPTNFCIQWETAWSLTCNVYCHNHSFTYIHMHCGTNSLHPHQSDLATLCADVSFPACCLGWILDGHWLFRNWHNFEVSYNFRAVLQKCLGATCSQHFPLGDWKNLFFCITLSAGYLGFHVRNPWAPCNVL